MKPSIRITPELIRYLVHILMSPLLSLHQRDEALKLTRRRAQNIRAQLLQAQLIKLVPAYPDKPRGTKILQCITPEGRGLVQFMKVDLEDPEGSFNSISSSIERPTKKQKGTGQRLPAPDQVIELYRHLQDPNWLQHCRLARLPIIRELRMRSGISEATALRQLLLESAQRVIGELKMLPDSAVLQLLIERFIEGRSTAQIARELQLSRRWYEQHHRREALIRLANQFIQLLSHPP